MNTARWKAVRSSACINCGFCVRYLDCPAADGGCIGCGACVKACPEAAVQLTARSECGQTFNFTLNGRSAAVSGPVSLKTALAEAASISAAEPGCGSGGCWSCTVLVDGEPVRACMTPVRTGMAVETDPARIAAHPPRRVVTLMRPPPHFHPSIFTHGCNFTCDLCHNWDLTFAARGRVLTPSQTVAELNLDASRNDWVGISGGEPTLNPRWLLETVRRLRDAAPKSRIQLDTNASLLTPELIDRLVAAGVTDISPDVKAWRLETFMAVTRVTDSETAERYLKNAWAAVRYLNDACAETVFTAVSVPCHPRTHSLDELEEIADQLHAVNPALPVTLIEYQPAFRRRGWPFASQNAMNRVTALFQSRGLKRVILQSGREMPRATDPLDLALSSEEF